MTHDELGALLVERALLEGDFVLRSGRRSSWYLDKYRFETEPDVLQALGERLAGAAREHEPEAVRLAGPALGAVALAASAALASGLPFIIVRGETKEYGTAKRIEGPFEPGELVCLLEDVVTSGGALAEAVSALRERHATPTGQDGGDAFTGGHAGWSQNEHLGRHHDRDHQALEGRRPRVGDRQVPLYRSFELGTSMGSDLHSSAG